MAQWKFVEWLIIWFLDNRIFNFEWDSGNSEKSLLKHDVSIEEAESVFILGESLPLGIDINTKNEDRFGLIGFSNQGRYLQIAFSIRNNKIRIISARPANKKEKIHYEKIKSKITERI